MTGPVEGQIDVPCLYLDAPDDAVTVEEGPPLCPRKPVADVTRYVHQEGDSRYQLTYTRQKTVLRTKFLDGLKGFKWLAAKLVGFDGCYLRFSGTLRIEQFAGEQVVEQHEAEAIWELMYFGSHKHDEQ